MSDKKKEKYQKMADEHNKNVPETVKWEKTGGVRGRPKKADPITAEGVFTKEFREKVLSEKGVAATGGGEEDRVRGQGARAERGET